MKLVLFYILFLFGGNLIAQQTWSYQMWFELYDKNGKEITKEKFKENGYQILATNDAAHPVSYLNYNDEIGCFIFFQRTTSPLETILFVNNNDTTILRIPTQTFYAKDVRITSGYFRFELDKDGTSFSETRVRDIFPNRRIYSCTNAFLDYLVIEYNKDVKLYSDNLIVVPLEY